MSDPAAAPPAEPELSAPTGTPERTGAPERRDLGVAAVLGALGALFATARVWGAPTRRFAGDWHDPDVLSFHWVARGIAELEGALHTAVGYAPVGETPLATLGGAAAAFSAPLVAVLGWPLGLNVYTVLVCAANAAAATWLARIFGADRAGAWVGGLGFALSPYLLGELGAGRLGQLPAWALLAAVGSWIRLLEAPTRRRALTVAAFFGVACLEYAWYGLLGAVAAAILLVVAGRADGGRWRDRGWQREVAIGVGASALASVPSIWLLAGGMPVAAPPAAPQPVTLAFSLLPAWPLTTTGGPLVHAAVSFVLVALALVALARSADWRARGLLVVALVGWVLSLGPRMLTDAGPVVDSHFPFYVVYSLLFPGFLYPYQHVLLVTLAVAMLAGVGASRVFAFLPARAGPIAAAALLLAMTGELRARGVDLEARVSELAPPPGWVTQIQALPGGAIVGLPLAPELRTSQEALVLQVLHGRPTVDGRSMWRDDQRPAAWDEAIEHSGFLKELVRFERGREVKEDPTRANYFRYPTEDVQRLVGEGVRFVMVWDTLYPDAIKGLGRAEKKLFEMLCGPPVMTAEGVAIYDLANHRGAGELVAPVWRFPEGLRAGDGIRPMAGRQPPGVLFVREE